MTLTGKVAGQNRQELIDNATPVAAVYYGLPASCVRVRLENEEVEYIETSHLNGSVEIEVSAFTADFIAEESHADARLTRDGVTAKCDACGETWESNW